MVQFQRDVELMFLNAQLYNPPTHDAWKEARNLRNLGRQLYPKVFVKPSDFGVLINQRVQNLSPLTAKEVLIRILLVTMGYVVYDCVHICGWKCKRENFWNIQPIWQSKLYLHNPQFFLSHGPQCEAVSQLIVIVVQFLTSGLV